MDDNRVIQVFIDVPVGSFGDYDMSEGLAPGGVGKDYSGAKPVLGDTLRTIPANPSRAGLMFQNQSDADLVLAFYHSESSYTQFVMRKAPEDGSQGSAFTMSFFRFTGKVTLHGHSGAQFALMELNLS